MANIIKPVGKLVAGVLGLPTSAPEAPPVEAPKTMPTADAAAVRRAKKLSAQRAAQGSGRASTLLSQAQPGASDKLGA